MRKNKQAILIFVLFLSITASNATTYYVRTNGSSTTSGRSDAYAWNYATLNSKILAPGDSVLFRRGDTFFGELTTSSGTNSQTVFYGAYGTGANPVISGLATFNNWTLLSGNIYYTDLKPFSPSTVNLVTINNRVTSMGRYPNTGYLNYTGHTGNSSISGTAIGTIPFDAAGGEAVIRKVRWIIDRHPITSHAGNSLLLSATSLDGGSLGYAAVDKNGFFIQNHLATLDRDGEWYYDRTARRLYMFLTSTDRTIKVSVLDRLAGINSKSNIRFADLDFEGSNRHGMSINGGLNIAFERCHFYNHGQTAIYGNGAINLRIKEGSIQHCLNNGIWIEQGGNGVTVDGVHVMDIGLTAGAGRSGDGAQQAISVHGNSINISNCLVRRAGYNGINFDGNNAVVEHNVVDSFCLVKDDGGGIYTYENDGVTVSNRVIRNNIVLNAVGAFAGSEGYYYEAFGKAAGIYLDGYSNHTNVSNNVVAFGEWAGIFVNNNSENQIVSNLFYDHSASIHLLQSRAGNIRNMTINGNECIARTRLQKTLFIQMFEKDAPENLGTFSTNFYARPVDDTRTITVERNFVGGVTEHLTLAQWRYLYNEDAGSGKSNATTDDPSKLRFEYNPTVATKVVSIKGSWKDIYNILYQSSLVLPSYSGKVVMSTTSVTPTLPVKENSFTATQAGTHVRLQWKGIGEGDASFAVERSANGIDFMPIGEVKASGLPSETAYAFLDRQPLTGTNFYRLKTVETTGNISYTKVISIKMNTQAALQVYPNPASNRITVQVPAQNGEVLLKLSDISGRMVHSQKVTAPGHTILYSIDIGHLAKGQYLLMTNTSSVIFVKQ